MSNFREFDRETRFLLPPSLDEWLPEQHLARFVVEVIDGLDLSAMVKSYRGTWTRRAVGEGVKFCPRAGCGRPFNLFTSSVVSCHVPVCLNGTGNFGSHNREFSAKNREFSRLSSNGDGRDNQKWPLTGADEIFGSDNCRDARHEHRSNISDQNFTHGGSASA